MGLLSRLFGSDRKEASSTAQAAPLLQEFGAIVLDAHGDSVRATADSYIAGKRATFTGRALTEQFEKNAVYNCEGARDLIEAAAEYLVAGTPRLSEAAVGEFVATVSRKRALAVTPLHLRYLSVEGCRGCDVHLEHETYAKLKTLRVTGGEQRYLDEVELCCRLYLALCVFRELYLTELLLRPELAGVAAAQDPPTLLKHIREQTYMLMNVCMGNMAPASP